METLRKGRLKDLQANDKSKKVIGPAKISAIFNENVFTLEVAREFMTKNAFEELKLATESRHKIDRSAANQIAGGIKTWAISKGVTHYTHWFQPLSGVTAEKHDTFFSLSSDGKAIEVLDGNALIQQEPDASSFPSGGLRATFEARGYTAWTPSSPIFIIDIDGGKTLCIPTVFISYNGQTLDYKAPLIKSCDALNKAAVKVARFFDKNIQSVTATLGWEQEYFLVDAGLAMARPDLVMSHRTVLGNASAKGQQLEDHYFGSIDERVYHYMREVENQAYKLGIPLKTRHNEVAPAQFECAPIFEEVSIAVDHNLLLMDIMDRVAKKHNFMAIFHEKPFANINGSGKHNNWSMCTNTGINLLSPGKTPKSNLMFLTFFINTIKAVHDHPRALLSSIASAGNDHRLGANEAPPGIISVFIGSFLTKVLQEIEDRVDDKFDKQDEPLFKLDIHKSIPEVFLDNTDRNRTSPFAFTGNKFEFRAVGSSTNCASPMTVMNTIMANTLSTFSEEVEKRIEEKEEKKEVVILQVLRDYIKSSKNILFSGDGYSQKWEQIAEKRNLPNINNAPEALAEMSNEKLIQTYTKYNIFTKEELLARQEIEYQKYLKNLDIESVILVEMLQSNIIPVAITYQKTLCESLQKLKELNFSTEKIEAQQDLLKELTYRINGVLSNIQKLNQIKQSIDESNQSLGEKATDYCKKLCPLFNILREHADRLEILVDDQLWRLPKYRELLFLR